MSANDISTKSMVEAVIDPKPFPLLRLPLELRQHIYDLAIVNVPVLGSQILETHHGYMLGQATPMTWWLELNMEEFDEMISEI